MRAFAITKATPLESCPSAFLSCHGPREGELVGFNVLLATALGDEALRERRTFSVSQHPANHVAGEDVEDDVEVVVGPLDGATKLRNIPRPNLVGRFGQQLRLRVVRMAPLVPALSDLAVLLQNPIHRANRAEVGSLVQKRGPHLGGRLVDEPLTVQGPEDFLALSLVEGSVRPRTPLRFGRHLAPAIQRGTSHTQSLAAPIPVILWSTTMRVEPGVGPADDRPLADESTSTVDLYSTAPPSKLDPSMVIRKFAFELGFDVGETDETLGGGVRGSAVISNVLPLES